MIRTGYNIKKFDFPYITTRAQVLGLPKVGMIGRTTQAVDVTVSLFVSAATGAQERVEIAIPGRIVLDMYSSILGSKKLPAYTLNYVSDFFLKSRKADLHHRHVAHLYYKCNTRRKHLY